jgi:predicted FMN-binding regulatory protein PaiB
VIFHDYYAQISTDEVERFVATQELGRLVTGGADGPHIGLYPFAYTASAIEIHLVRTDEQTQDLRAQPRCLFEVDEPLSTIPSYWVDPENAIYATAYHRTVIFDCVARVGEDVTAIAAQQMRLMARYQPEGRFRAVSAEDPMYKGALHHIAAITLTVERTRVKFKLAQNRTPDSRRAIIAELRRRNRPNDVRAAAAVESTLDSTPVERGHAASGSGHVRPVPGSRTPLE